MILNITHISGVVAGPPEKFPGFVLIFDEL